MDSLCQRQLCSVLSTQVVLALSVLSYEPSGPIVDPAPSRQSRYLTHLIFFWDLAALAACGRTAGPRKSLKGCAESLLDKNCKILNQVVNPDKIWLTIRSQLPIF
jgi:hypothetical protein